MIGKIPQAFIDDLVARIDIIDVIHRRVPLKKAGHEYKACCPFHDEKTPSFTVSPSKQFYHCFGCGAHGTAIGFLMEFDRLSYPEAIEALAESAGLEVPREAAANRGPDLAPLYNLLAQAEQFYERQLRSHADASRAVDYLRQRGLSGEISARFRIGFAPPGWDNLLSALGSDDKRIRQLRDAGLITEQDGKRYDRLRDRIIFPIGWDNLLRALGTSGDKTEQLRRCGLIADRDQGGSYDRLRDRIVFPIHDTRGRVIGFGGRVLGDGTPKYLNSPETAVFHKGRELYGWYEAKQANRQLDRLLVVEGYMDVVALAQFGIQDAVATLGTATTAEHVDKLFRQVPEIVFCFDGDRAGRDAAWKALETALPYMRDGRQARFLFLPEGEDPDSVVRERGAERFHDLATSAESLSSFLFRHLAQGIDLAVPEGRARLAGLAKPLIGRVPAGVFRELLSKELADQVRIENLFARESSTRQRKRTPRDDVRPRSLMQQTIALILQHPDQVIGVASSPELNAAKLPGADILTKLLESVRANPHITTGGLIEQCTDQTIKPMLGRLAQARLDLNPESDIARQIGDGIGRLASQARRAELKALAARELSSLSREEKQRLRELSSMPAPKV